MKVFREIIISGNAAQLQHVVAGIEAALADGWSRDRASEESAGFIGTTSTIYCITVPAAPAHPQALLWMGLYPDKGQLCITNITPTAADQLSADAYNAIVQDFYNRFAAPVAASSGVTIELTSDNAEIEDWAGPRAAALLRDFSRAANKSTGSSHPHDRKRWEHFVIAAHKYKARLTASDLQRWLVEEERWPEDVASDLAAEYEKLRSAFATYDTAG